MIYTFTAVHTPVGIEGMKQRTRHYVSGATREEAFKEAQQKIKSIDGINTRYSISLDTFDQLFQEEIQFVLDAHKISGAIDTLPEREIVNVLKQYRIQENQGV